MTKMKWDKVNAGRTVNDKGFELNTILPGREIEETGRGDPNYRRKRSVIEQIIKKGSSKTKSNNVEYKIRSFTVERKNYPAASLSVTEYHTE